MMMAVGACMMLSCSADKGRALPLYAIERTAYEDMLVVEGYTESVNSVNVNCPRDVDGTIVQIVENGTYVEAGDTVCVIEDTNIENNVENWRVDLEGMYAEMEKLKATQRLEYALLEAQVRNNEAETLLADADSLRMIYMSPTDRRIKELQLIAHSSIAHSSIAMYLPDMSLFFFGVYHFCQKCTNLYMICVQVCVQFIGLIFVLFSGLRCQKCTSLFPLLSFCF